MNDKRNKEAFQYWDASWKTEGVQSFSPHTTLIEEAKWYYFQQDLKGYSGRSLEVGCGSGHFSALLAEAGFNAILLDYSSSAIECARKSFLVLEGWERKRYLLGDALALPVADGAIDVVVSCGVLEHFEEPLRPMREMVRVLRAGGLFYSDICPRKFTLIGMLDFLHKTPGGWYEARINKNQIQEMLVSLGLANIRIFGAGVLPPRNIPAKGRIKIVSILEKVSIGRLRRFWLSMDATRLGEWLGSYYYVSATKPHHRPVKHAPSEH
jgi:SAM-dependent methyltransferase